MPKLVISIHPNKVVRIPVGWLQLINGIGLLAVSLGDSDVHIILEYLDNAVVSLEHRGGEPVMALSGSCTRRYGWVYANCPGALVRIAQQSPAVLSAIGSGCLGDPSSCCFVILVFDGHSLVL